MMKLLFKKKEKEWKKDDNNQEMNYLWGGVSSTEKDPGGTHRESEWFLVMFWFLN